MADAAAAQVAVEVVVDGGGSSGRGRRTVMRLLWSHHDPLAVRMLLTAQPDHPALPRGEWVVLRDFLRYGLESRTGDGEVRLWPDAEHDRVAVELARGDRPFRVTLPRAAVARFLDATEQLVPSGAECADDVLDALITRLLEA